MCCGYEESNKYTRETKYFRNSVVLVGCVADLEHGGVLVQAVDVPGDGVDQPHAVEVRVAAPAPAQPTRQQRDDAADVRRVPELDHVEAAVREVHLQRRLVRRSRRRARARGRGGGHHGGHRGGSQVRTPVCKYFTHDIHEFFKK